MPAAKYDGIYRDLKNKIESEQYEFQELLPSENQLVEVYGCSRNTVRRAIAGLVTDGYVQTVQGKGVRNIYRPVPQSSFTIGEGLEYGAAIQVGDTVYEIVAESMAHPELRASTYVVVRDPLQEEA